MIEFLLLLAGNKMSAKLLLLVACSLWISSVSSSWRYRHPDFDLDAKQMIQKYGYPLEVHTVETEDGYILEVHRIPHGRNGTKTGHPILFVPGLVCSSAEFLTQGPGISLAYILADEGYDIWIVNPRGSRWSRKHRTLDPDLNNKEFFDISFQEIGIYDITATIDYILRETSREQLFYVGHSQGTTSVLAMLAARPEYNDKIILMTALAPVAYTANSNHILYKILDSNLPLLQHLLDSYGVYQLLPHSQLLTLVGRILCNDYALTQPICETIVYLYAGYSTNFNTTLLPVILTNTPAGASMRMFYHYIQLAISGQFQMYDFGQQQNLIRYGQASPPKLDLTKVTLPSALYYSKQDALSAAKDVELLAADLRNLVRLHLVEGYSHLDYLWAKNVNVDLYQYVVETIKSYSI
ncbi:lipase 1-like [Photinus pyralis]|uniref:lipase 1-like n=1 Tax=Photinus pyralis TaxID=7054 RepID=UPI0012671165|nr:lipase 1-like [Photinus pyralis]